MAGSESIHLSLLVDIYQHYSIRQFIIQNISKYMCFKTRLNFTFVLADLFLSFLLKTAVFILCILGAKIFCVCEAVDSRQHLILTKCGTTSLKWKPAQEVWRRSDWGTSPAEELVERCVGDSRGQGSDPDGEQLPLYETEEKDVALWLQFTLKKVRKH